MLYGQVPTKLKNGGYVPFVRSKSTMYFSLPPPDIERYNRCCSLQVTMLQPLSWRCVGRCRDEEDYRKRLGLDTNFDEFCADK